MSRRVEVVMLAGWVLIASVMFMGNDRTGCERDQQENPLVKLLAVRSAKSTNLDDKALLLGRITLTHKPNSVILQDKAWSATYYIAEINVHENQINETAIILEQSVIGKEERSKESIIKDILQKVLAKGIDCDLYDKIGNRLLRFSFHRYGYDYYLTQEEGGKWTLTWKGIIPEDSLTYEYFRDISSVSAKLR